MTKRFYTTDDSFNIDWVDLDVDNPINSDFLGYVYFNVLDSKDGTTEYNFYEKWIYDPKTKEGVWHETPQGLAKQMRERAKEINKITTK